MRIKPARFRRRKNTVFILLFVLLISSCAPTYVPNVLNSPLLESKGELQASLHTGTAGIDPQIAYAITDNIAVMVNGSFANRGADDLSKNFHKHSFVEFGTGYTTTFSEQGIFEIYGGYGSGTINSLHETGLWTASADVKNSRIFLQPAIGTRSQIFDASIASRFVVNNISQGGISTTGYHIEPVFTGKVGTTNMKVVLQFGLSFPVSPDFIGYNYQRFLISFGLQGYINRK